MGGYGGSSGRVKKKNDCYYDSKNKKVDEPHSIIVAEYYLNLGMAVVFLQEKPEEGGRPDLLVDYEFFAEVKGIGSIKAGTIAKQIKHASKQISDEIARQSEDNELVGKIVILSKHADFEAGFKAVYEGYQEAKRKNQVHFQTEFWFYGKIHILE
ncbi:MAG: hypothetical protein IJT73_09450 [Selenomonadaceae bacterium]|nr:hypothetical protein [Selenomonadaceae bacterium]